MPQVAYSVHIAFPKHIHKYMMLLKKPALNVN